VRVYGSGVWCVCRCVRRGCEVEGRGRLEKVVGEGGEEGEVNEAQHEWARSGGQRTSLSTATPRGPWACPVSRRAVSEVPAAWGCCRQMSEMRQPHHGGADGALTVDGGARLSLWTQIKRFDGLSASGIVARATLLQAFVARAVCARVLLRAQYYSGYEQQTACRRRCVRWS
jgi:hypothetical protein